MFILRLAGLGRLDIDVALLQLDLRLLQLVLGLGHIVDKQLLTRLYFVANGDKAFRDRPLGLQLDLQRLLRFHDAGVAGDLRAVIAEPRQNGDGIDIDRVLAGGGDALPLPEHIL